MSKIEDDISKHAQAYLKVKHDSDAVYFYDSRLRGKVSYTFEYKKDNISIVVKDARPVMIDNKRVKVIKYNFNYM